MADREKVIRGLKQHCEGSIFDRCGECPYYKFEIKPSECRDKLLEDAFTLLNEQEAIESMNFGDATETMANLEGLTWDDWHMYHSDSEVQNITKSAFDLLITLLKEQEPVPVRTLDAWPFTVEICGNCGEVLPSIGGNKVKFCLGCRRKVKRND